MSAESSTSIMWVPKYFSAVSATPSCWIRSLLFEKKIWSVDVLKGVVFYHDPFFSSRSWMKSWQKGEESFRSFGGYRKNKTRFPKTSSVSGSISLGVIEATWSTSRKDLDVWSTVLLIWPSIDLFSIKPGFIAEEKHCSDHAVSSIVRVRIWRLFAQF